MPSDGSALERPHDSLEEVLLEGDVGVELDDDLGTRVEGADARLEGRDDRCAANRGRFEGRQMDRLRERQLARDLSGGLACRIERAVVDDQPLVRRHRLRGHAVGQPTKIRRLVARGRDDRVPQRPAHLTRGPRHARPGEEARATRRSRARPPGRGERRARLPTPAFPQAARRPGGGRCPRR